jgi:hypothetical protein
MLRRATRVVRRRRQRRLDRQPDAACLLSTFLHCRTVVCLGGGYWLRYRSRKIACADVEICARPLPNRIVTIGLVLATVLVAGTLALDFLAPLFL